MAEPGSELVDALWNDAARATTVVVAYAEVRAALARAVRERRLSSRGHGSSTVDLEERWNDIDVLAVDEPLAHAAGRLAEQHALRALDAIHLAGALALAGADLVVATWDDRLGGAARASGLNVAP